MIPESLEEALSDLDKRGELERVKILYVGSYHQNPSGVTLSLERRPAILDIVRRWERHGRILVIDDAAYRELSYDSTSMPSLLSFDESRERVILAQTFSKSFSPGLKTGFSILPSDLMEPVLQQKGNHDFGSSNLNQQILAETLDRGHYASHVENLRRLYHEKCQVMLEAIDQEFPRLNLDAKWVRPEGGLFVWMTLPPEIETTHDSQLFQRCIENGVLYVPGEYCFATDAWEETGELGGPRSTMRLTFGTQSPEGIREGIRRLASSIAQCIEDD